MVSKTIIIVIGFLIFIIGTYLFIIYGTNIPELVENQRQRENQPSYEEQLETKYSSLESCNDVINNPNSYYREIVDRCKQFLPMSQP